MDSKVEENYKRLREELNERLNKDKRLTAIMDKISKGTATFKDSAEYSQIVADHMGDVISKNIGNIKIPMGKEMVCKELLKENIERVDTVFGKVQVSVDEKMGIHLNPVTPPYPTERVNAIANSLEDPNADDEKVARRGKSSGNVVAARHDENVKANAAWREEAGFDCYIVRDAGGGCCAWCAALAGRYKYADAPDDVFRRHDHCTCTTTYECGRMRQDVWSKRTWQADPKDVEARIAASDATTATRLTPEQAKAIDEQSKPIVFTQAEAKEREQIALESSKFKAKYPETSIVRQDIYSPDYRRHFNEFGENANATSVMCEQSRNMLTHRTGTKYEDMAFIDSRNGRCKVQKGYNVENEVRPTQAMKEMVRESPPNTIIAIHNHPGSTVPSIQDLDSCYKNQYKYGIIPCHNGNAFRYRVSGDFDKTEVDLLLDRTQNVLYNKEKIGDEFEEKLTDVLGELKKRNIELEVFLWK
jgi:proteasome lid subunit RPN8/RPN11